MHFVNYNRREPEGKKSAGRGFVDDNPIAVEKVAVDVLVPAGSRVLAVEFLSPEEPIAVKLEYAADEGRVRFTVPKFLVYGITKVQLERVGP